MRNFKCEARENGLRITGIHPYDNGSPIEMLLSYRESRGGWAQMSDWAADHDGKLPSREEWNIIQEHVDQINDALRAAGKSEIMVRDGFYWTAELRPHSPGHAWVLAMEYKNDFDTESIFIVNRARLLITT
jgi:hypothetical protein